MLAIALAACTDPEVPGRGDGPTPTPPVDDVTTCTHDDGFEISYPASWHTGEDDFRCSQFHPEPFEVAEGTDRRVAAITAYVDPVPFHEAAAPDPGRSADRAVTVIDGFQAVRLDYEAGDDHLYGAGTPIRVYMIDVSVGVDDGPGTLFVDAVGLSGFDHEENRVVLDRMARSIDVDFAEAGDVVARYEGAGGFTVEARDSGDESCLRIPPGGEWVCSETPGPQGLRTIHLVNLDEPMLTGVTGSEVFRVTAERRDGGTSSYLPAPVPGSDLRGFAFTFDLDAIAELIWYDLEGEELDKVSF